MSGRHPVVRFIVLFWASVQLLSPGISAIADGELARESASRPLAHIEAGTTSACPVVHAPDCGVCRYLSSSAPAPRADVLTPASTGSCPAPRAESRESRAAFIALPRGRSPPAI